MNKIIFWIFLKENDSIYNIFIYLHFQKQLFQLIKYNILWFKIRIYERDQFLLLLDTFLTTAVNSQAITSPNKSGLAIRCSGCSLWAGVSLWQYLYIIVSLSEKWWDWIKLALKSISIWWKRTKQQPKTFTLH